MEGLSSGDSLAGREYQAHSPVQKGSVLGRKTGSPYKWSSAASEGGTCPLSPLTRNNGYTERESGPHRDERETVVTVNSEGSLH